MQVFLVQVTPLPTKMLALIVLLSAVMVGCAVLFAGFLGQSGQPNMEPVEGLLWVKNCFAQKSSDALNISLTVTGTDGESVPIEEFEINGVSQNDLGDLTVYVNGTSVAPKGRLPLFVVEDREVFVVNLVLHTAFFGEPFDGGFVRVAAVTPNARYYAETAY